MLTKALTMSARVAPCQDFSTGVTADSKLPKHLVEEIMPLLDRCEVTFIVLLLHPPPKACQADAHVDLCQFINDLGSCALLSGLCDP